MTTAHSQTTIPSRLTELKPLPPIPDRDDPALPLPASAAAPESEPPATTFLEPAPALSFLERLSGRIAIVGVLACTILGPGTTGVTRHLLLLGAGLSCLILAVTFSLWLVKEESGKIRLVAVIPGILVFLTALTIAACLWVAASLLRGGI